MPPQPFMGKVWEQNLLLVSPFNVLGVRHCTFPPSSSTDSPKGHQGLAEAVPTHPDTTRVPPRWVTRRSTPATSIPVTSSLPRRPRLSNKARARNFSQNTYLMQRAHSWSSDGDPSDMRWQVGLVDRRIRLCAKVRGNLSQSFGIRSEPFTNPEGEKGL